MLTRSSRKWRVQQSLLPEQLPEVPGLSVATSYLTSDQAGGDYDFCPCPAASSASVVADVSGSRRGARPSWPCSAPSCTATREVMGRRPACCATPTTGLSRPGRREFRHSVFRRLRPPETGLAELRLRRPQPAQVSRRGDTFHPRHRRRRRASARNHRGPRHLERGSSARPWRLGESCYTDGITEAFGKAGRRATADTCSGLSGSMPRS